MSWRHIRKGSYVIVSGKDHCLYTRDPKAKRVKGWPLVEMTLTGQIKELADDHLAIKGIWRDGDTVEFGTYSIARGAIDQVWNVKTGKVLYVK